MSTQLSNYTVRLPDVGEGVAEAELVEWHVQVGETVTPDTVVAEVLTDKATVEIFPPVGGVVAELHGEPGDVLAVGGPLVSLTTESAAPAPAPAEPDRTPAPAPEPAPAPAPAPEPAPASSVPSSASAAPTADPAPAAGGRVLAAPAVRARARALGIDLATVAGSGANRQVVHADLDRLLAGGTTPVQRVSAGDGVRVEPVRGLRRKISEKLSAAWTEIPHITYVDAVDATEVEALRKALNARGNGPKLTLLPFLARAIVLAVADQPQLNAHFDSSAGNLSVFDAVHIGIATQTDAGLAVPVVRHAEGMQPGEFAAELSRLAQATRDNKATREELSGSTITITSLGALGGLVTTPIVNAPEVTIVGVNKFEMRPVWRDGAFVPRQMFNISASFDHRIVDGWDAAVFVQRLRELIETPALMFVD